LFFEKSLYFTVELERAGFEVHDMCAAKAEALLRCAQEGLTNALRHGAATEVLVTLSRSSRDRRCRRRVPEQELSAQRG